MKTIPLSQGRVTQVDDEDYEWLMEWKWYVIIKKLKDKQVGYAVRKRMGVTITLTTELAKRYGFWVENGDIEHLDGDNLNNQKANLRSSAGSLKEAVMVPAKRSSEYKGVSWDVTKGRWQAILVHSGVKYHLGRFVREDAAAKAYDKRAVELMGTKAELNFPPLKKVSND